MIIKYVNAFGDSVELNNANIKLREADFFSYEWDVTEASGKYTLSKAPKRYEAYIEVTGNSAMKKAKLNNFFEITERDVIADRTGKLYLGEQYLECYVIQSKTEPAESPIGVDKNLVILSAKPFWITEEKYIFYAASSPSAASGLDFPFDFPFDFAPEENETEYRTVDHYAPSHFKMLVYGPCVNPKITINGYPRQVFTTLESNEYMIIDSRENSVTKYLANGTTQDIYNSRQFAPSIFEKIPGGQLTFNRSGTFGYEVMFYLERSEPKW